MCWQRPALEKQTVKIRSFKACSQCINNHNWTELQFWTSVFQWQRSPVMVIWPAAVKLGRLVLSQFMCCEQTFTETGQWSLWWVSERPQSGHPGYTIMITDVGDSHTDTHRQRCRDVNKFFASNSPHSSALSQLSHCHHPHPSCGPFCRQVSPAEPRGESLSTRSRTRLFARRMDPKHEYNNE